MFWMLKWLNLSGFCHLGLVLFMVLWRSPDTPFLSCFHVSVRLRVCSSRALSCLRALFCVGACCSDPGTHVLSFGFVSGFGHSRSMFCLIVWACGSSSLGRALSCPRVLCVCGFARSSCFYWLRAFMLSCLVWTREHVRVLFCTWLVICFAGHVLVLVLCEHMAFVLVFCVPCALSVNCLDPTHLVTWLLVNLPHLCLSHYPPHLLPL